MPLRKGSSKKVISQNIREFHTGKTYAHTAAKFGKEKADKQAVAVALHTARRYGRKYASGGSDDGWSPDDEAPVSPEVTTAPKPDPSFEDRVMATLKPKSRDLAPSTGPELRASPPQTWREKIGSFISGNETENSPARQHLAKALVGTTGIGAHEMGLADLTPAGIPLAAQEAKTPEEFGMAIAGGPTLGPIAKGALAAGKGMTQAQEASLLAKLNEVLVNPANKGMLTAEDHAALDTMAEKWAAAEHGPYKQVPFEEQYPRIPPSPMDAKDKPINAEGWTQIGDQKGSNPGGFFADPRGQKWYLKQPKSEDHASNEILAARLYELAGVPVPHISPAIHDGGPALASKMVDGYQLASYPVPAVKTVIAKDMPIDAWLGNWDAIGTGKDNIIMSNGVPYRIDMGGALRYRAQGAPKGKAFGPEVNEWTTFTDPKINKDAADIFGGVDKAHMADAVQRLDAITPGQIAGAIEKWGPRDEAAKMELFDTLIQRKQSVIDQFYKEMQPQAPQQAWSATDFITNKIKEPSLPPADKAHQLIALAKIDPEQALSLKNSLPKAEQKKINPALWAIGNHAADPETKAVINNLYTGKVKAQAKAAGMSDKDYLASLKAKKEAYKTSHEKSDADWAAEQAEYEGNMSAKEAHEEQINTGNYAEVNDKKINPEFKSEPMTEERFNEVVRPVKNWQEWEPPVYGPERWKNGAGPRPQGPFEFPNAIAKPEELGYNTKVPLFKGGYETFHGELPDPSVKWEEKAWFAAHHPEVAKAYGQVHTYFHKANKVLEMNWPEFTGYYHYGGTPMSKAIKLARDKGADVLILHNMVDMAGYKWSGEPHTQIAILKTEGLRHIEAKFDPSQLHLRHSHAGLVGGGLLGYGLLRGDNEGNGMKKGGRTPSKMAIGGFNPMKWIPRPNNLERPSFRTPSPAHVGMIHSAVPGRTDSLPMKVKGGSYVIPASVVSGMAQGNSIAGANALNKMFRQGPYGDAAQKFGTPKVNFGHPMQGPRNLIRMPNHAAAGGVEGDNDTVPIMAAGGEYIVSPEAVKRLGGGDMKKGHRILDELVMHIRRQTIKDMKNEKPPKK